jgi:hypothetical protein
MYWLISAVRHYGSPAFARKRTIWPLMSKEANLATPRTGADELRTLRAAGNIAPVAAEYGASVAAGAQSTLPLDVVPKEMQLKLTMLTCATDVLYHPLHEGKIFRILELHSGMEDEPITCSFHYANLDHLHMEYEALSYAWGNRTDEIYNVKTRRWDSTQSVQCNGHNTEISPRLYQALKYTRLPTEPVYLWADALCINQNDVTERNHQVTLMSFLYRNARKVLIWIGEQKKNSVYGTYRGMPSAPTEFEDVRAQRAFGAICDIVNRWQGIDPGKSTASYTLHTKSKNEAPQEFSTFEEYPSSARDHMDQGLMRRCIEDQYNTQYPQYYGTEDLSVEEETHDPDLGIDSTSDSAPNSQFWLSIADLFDRTWFWRVWVVQESILARAAVVKWANAEIDWKFVGLAAAILRNSYGGICEEMKTFGVYNAYLMFRMSPMSDLPPPNLSFLQLLRLTRQLEVTNPRDRVYGLLGMTTVDNNPGTNSLFIDPDYTITEAELWLKVAWKMIRDTGNLSILSSVQYTAHHYESEHAHRNSDIHRSGEVTSSWVPQWDHVFRTTLAAWDLDERFEAAKGFPLDLLNATDETPEVLRVGGIQVGTVGYTGSYMWHDVDTGILALNYLGPFFATESGLRLLARVYTAGRNAYGSLTKSTDEALSDFAAYTLLLHDRSITDSQPDDNDVYAEGLLSEREYYIRDSKSFETIFHMHSELKGRLETLAQKGDAARFQQGALAMCIRRRLFLTLNGFIGLGPDTVQEGDIVTVLSGGDIPYLLRPIANPELLSKTESASSPTITQTSSGQSYIFVGECYVEGVMCGEAVQAVNQKSHLVGSVPCDLVMHEILASMQAYTATASEAPISAPPEKTVFNIW